MKKEEKMGRPRVEEKAIGRISIQENFFTKIKIMT